MTKAQLLAALKLYKAKEDTVNDGKFVAKEDGKGLSSTDVTADMVAKWDAAATAEADVTQEEIDSIFTA